MCVFCKYFLHKVAKTFCRLLQLHFVGDCNGMADMVPAIPFLLCNYLHFILQQTVRRISELGGYENISDSVISYKNMAHENGGQNESIGNEL